MRETGREGGRQGDRETGREGDREGGRTEIMASKTELTRKCSWR